MAGVKTDYWQRLPSGLRYDPKTGREMLFDRGYRAIAQRPRDHPERVTLLNGRPHIAAQISGKFYNPSDGAGDSKEGLERCEMVFARFNSGCDVRQFLWEGRDEFPKGKGCYLKLKPHPREHHQYVDRLSWVPQKVHPSCRAGGDLDAWLRAWLIDERPACEVLPDVQSDDTPMVRNLVNAGMAVADAQHGPVGDAVRRAGAATCGTLLNQNEMLTRLGRCRRLGERSCWHYRFADNKQAWVPVPHETSGVDYLLS